MTGLCHEPGLWEGRVRISARGPPPAAPSRRRLPSRSVGRSQPLDWAPGWEQLTPIPVPVQPPSALQTPATLTNPVAAHLPRTPDAGAAGSPSGGGLLPRSPSRDVPPAPEAASAMARAEQVRGYGRSGLLGAAGAWDRCSGRTRWRRRQRPHPPAPAAVPACLSTASRPRPRRTSSLLLGPEHVALGFSTPPLLFSGIRSRPPTSLSGARSRPHGKCFPLLVPARAGFRVSVLPTPDSLSESGKGMFGI